jgi:hypothetical protein
MKQLIGCHSMATDQLRQGPHSRCRPPPFLRGQNSIKYHARHGVTPGRSSSAISGVPVGRGIAQNGTEQAARIFDVAESGAAAKLKEQDEDHYRDR